MRRITKLLAWGTVVIVGALAALNWSTLLAPVPLDLVVAEIHAPMGVLMLGLACVTVVLFFIAHLQNQVAALRETRGLQRELQRLQARAEQADASRIEALHGLVATEFRRLEGRLEVVADATRSSRQDRDGRPALLSAVGGPPV